MCGGERKKINKIWFKKKVGREDNQGLPYMASED